MQLRRITFFGVKDLLRNRWTVTYFLFFVVLSEGLFRMTGDSAKVLSALLQVVLFIVPLVSLLFGALYHYNSRAYIVLLLTQPINRLTVYLGQYASLSVSLGAGLAVGVMLPVLIHTGGDIGDYLILLAVGLSLTLVFVGLAFVIALATFDRGKGVAITLLVWFIAAILYDGGLLLLAHMFSEYPLEGPMIVASLLNPIDLGRILLLIHLDYSTLMGYTGATFARFFGQSSGLLMAAVSLLCWVAAPFIFGAYRFSRQDM